MDFYPEKDIYFTNYSLDHKSNLQCINVYRLLFGEKSKTIIVTSGNPHPVQEVLRLRNEDFSQRDQDLFW